MLEDIRDTMTQIVTFILNIGKKQKWRIFQLPAENKNVKIFKNTEAGQRCV